MKAKRQPDPAGFYFSALLVFVLGYSGQYFQQYHREETGLDHPVAIGVKFIAVRCGTSKNGVHMTKPYTYSPAPLQRPANEYTVYDTVWFKALPDCEDGLKNAGATIAADASQSAK